MAPPSELHDEGEGDDSRSPDERAGAESSRPAGDTDHPQHGELLPILSARTVPPASLRDRILAAARPQTFAFVMQHEGPWLPDPAAPVAVKELLADSRDRLSTRLVRFREEGMLPSPALAGRRAFYIVRGSVARDDAPESIGAGGFRDEYPAQAWRASAGTLLIEYSEGVAVGEHAITQGGEVAPWVEALPGGRVRPLGGGHDGPRSFLVLSMSPGSTLPSHPHHGVEELYVLAGSCSLDGRTLSAGDYHRAASQSTHPDTYTLDDGCDVLVAVRDPDRLVRAEGSA